MRFEKGGKTFDSAAFCAIRWPMTDFIAKWLKVSLVVIMGCGFVAMMIYALVYRDEISTTEIEPPLITPPAEPLKRRPDQPGGKQIPNRDKLVFDLLDSSTTRLAATDVPPVEEVSITEADLTDEAATEPAEQTDEQQAAAAEPKPEVKAEVKPVAAKPAEPVAAAKPEAKPEVKPEVKPLAAKEPEPKIATPAAQGAWGVQLAAVSSAADGKAFAAKMQKQFAVLAPLTPRIQAAPGGKAYRVQLLGAATRDDAVKICNQLAGKQGCFPVSAK